LNSDVLYFTCGFKSTFISTSNTMSLPKYRERESATTPTIIIY